MSNAQVAKVSASVDLPGLSPEGLRFEMSVNSIPVATVVVSKTSGGSVSVTKPGSSEVIARIAALQKQRLSVRTAPDISIEAEDGIGGKLSFKGYISSPVLEITEVSTADQFSAVGEASVLDSLDLSIYDIPPVDAERAETSAAEQIDIAKTGNITATIAQVTDELLSQAEDAIAIEETDTAKEIIEILDSINKIGPATAWKQLLQNSSVVYKSIADSDVADTIAFMLVKRIRSELAAPTPGFWNKILSLMSAFQMHYIPSFTGYGKFVRSDVKVAEPEGTISVSVSGLTVIDGSTRMLPVGGVLMIGKSTPAERPESDETLAGSDVNFPNIAAFYPSPLQMGFMQREQPPFWLLYESGELILGSEVEQADGGSTADDGKLDLNLGRRGERLQKGKEYIQKSNEISTGVMTELCEVIFKEIQLATSTASLRLPLDFSVNDHVGKRVTVQIIGGGAFTAYVNGVNHYVALQAGKQLTSMSGVQLSHCKFEV